MARWEAIVPWDPAAAEIEGCGQEYEQFRSSANFKQAYESLAYKSDHAPSRKKIIAEMARQKRQEYQRYQADCEEAAASGWAPDQDEPDADDRSEFFDDDEPFSADALSFDPSSFLPWDPSDDAPPDPEPEPEPMAAKKKKRAKRKTPAQNAYSAETRRKLAKVAKSRKRRKDGTFAK